VQRLINDYSISVCPNHTIVQYQGLEARIANFGYREPCFAFPLLAP
jgi:hypothetical protein